MPESPALQPSITGTFPVASYFLPPEKHRHQPAEPGANNPKPTDPVPRVTRVEAAQYLCSWGYQTRVEPGPQSS